MVAFQAGSERCSRAQSVCEHRSAYSNISTFADGGTSMRAAGGLTPNGAPGRSTTRKGEIQRWPHRLGARSAP